MIFSAALGMPANSRHPRAMFKEISDSLELQRQLTSQVQQIAAPRRRWLGIGVPLSTEWDLCEAEGWTLQVKCLHRNDPSAPRTQPCEWTALILDGGYWDVSDLGRVWRAPGTTVRENGTRPHNVELRDGAPLWTLVLRSPEFRSSDLLSGALAFMRGDNHSSQLHFA